jgi:hypothetical protein
MTKKNIFYISLVETPINNGIIQSQVIRVLKAAVAAGHEATFFSSPSNKFYSRHTPEEIEAFKSELQSHGINFHCIPLPVISNACIRAFLIPFFILFELPIALYFSLKSKADILHCRSYPASLIGMLIKAVTGKKLIFDMRGVYPEEGNFLFKNWHRSGANFRTWKLIERALLKAADVTVVVSAAFGNHIKNINRNNKNKNISVIHCAPELALATSRPLPKGNEVNIVYSGTLDGWTSPALLANTFKWILDANKTISLHLNIYSTTNKQLIDHAFSAVNIENDKFTISALKAKDVQKKLLENDMAILVREKSIVNDISFPVKIGEYIAASLPILTNENIQGAQEFILSQEVGISLENSRYDISALLKNISQARRNCESALQVLQNAPTDYLRIYESI